jgi:hypothetical protein
MVDRPARDKAIGLIEDYLNDRLSAFEFDKAIYEIETKDPLLQVVTDDCWFYYDDIHDHQVNLSKPVWDLHQRLLLLLRSDIEISHQHELRWGWWNSAALLILVASAITLGGWGLSWLIFGAIATLSGLYGAAFLNLFLAAKPDPRDVACYPFDSGAQMRRLRRACPGSRKQRYRPEIGDRGSVSERALPGLLRMGFNAVGYVMMVALAFMLSPLFVLWQCWPIRHKDGYTLSGGQLGPATI